MESILPTALGAFLAAWFGATLAFRRTRKERALDHTVSWHQETIRALARYEGALEQLHRESRHALVVKREGNETPLSQIEGGQGTIPKTFHPEEDTWADLCAAEAEARELLRLADVFTEGRAKIECSVGLNRTVDLATKNWFDVGPAPAIPWVTLASRMSSVDRVRRYLQESLRIALELQGITATILGPRYRRWRTLRELERLRKELGVTEVHSSSHDVVKTDG